MMKKSKLLMMLLALATTSVALTSCALFPTDSSSSEPTNSSTQDSSDDSTDDSSTVPQLEEITLSELTKTLDRYESFTLTASVGGVTWSSDNESVATVVDGVVSAKGVGTATITASKEGAISATCTVTVEDSGAMPILQVSDSEITLVKDGTYALTSSVVYKRAEQTDAVITYTSADPTIAIVAADGTVSGLAYGTTTITVSAAWKDVETSFLTETITVKVKGDVAVSHEESDFTIYTSNISVDGEDFANTKQVTGSVLVDGSADNADATKISWVSENAEVVTVTADGVVTAVAEGTTAIKMKYEDVHGEYYSEPINVTVAFPTLDKTDSIFIDIDASLNTISEQVSGSKIFGADKNIVKIASADDLTTDIAADAEWINEHDVGDEAGRTNTLVIYNAEYAYQVKALVVTKILSTVEDLKNLQAYGNVTEVVGDKVTYYNYSGYFVLGNNIVVSESDGIINTKSMGKCDSASWLVNTNGFSGTFDGRGYSIVNAKFGAGGLLGDISKNAVVKNLAIVDATIAEEDSVHGANKGTGVVCFSFSGKAENLMISYTTMKARNGAFGRVNTGGTIKNTVIYYKKNGGYNGGAVISWLNSNMTVENVYAVYANGMKEADCKLNHDGAGSYSDTITEIQEADLASAIFTGLDENVWLLKEGQMPIFKSTVKEFAMSASGEVNVELGKELVFTAGLTNLAGNVMSYCPVTWTSSDETVATVENGALTLLAVGTTTIKATCGDYTASVVVNVAKPEIVIQDKTATTLYLDANGTSSLNEQIFYAATGANLFESFTAVKVVDTNDVDETDLSADSNWLKAVDGGAEREKTLIVYGEEVAYKVKVFVVTKIITTVAELNNMVNYASDKTMISSASTQAYSYGGYFVLGGNLTQDTNNPVTIQGPAMIKTATGTIHDNINSYALFQDANDNNALGKMGFHGTFDGLGYKVDGFAYGVGGVFGLLGAGAVVKNVAFTNCTIASAVKNTAILAQGAYGASDSHWKVENVYVQATMNGNNCGMLLGSYASAGGFVDIVAEMKTVGGYKIGAVSTGQDFTAENLVIIYDESGSRTFKDFVVCAGNPTKDYSSKGVTEYVLQADGTVKKIASKTTTDNAHVATYTTAETTATAAEFAGFDSSYWTVTEGKAPAFNAKN